MFELGIDGGTVVFPSGRARANVYISRGIIEAVTPERHASEETVDAAGLLVMPGMIDAHVHFMDPPEPEREDFPTGTAAAVRAGVTTVIEHTHADPVRNVHGLQRKTKYLAGRSLADYSLAAHAWPGEESEIPGLWAAGVAFIKAFTCTTHGIPGFNAGELRDLLREVASVGAVCLIHCEDDSMLDSSLRALQAAGRADGGVIPAWRNRDAEMVSLSVVGLLARYTRARVVAAHVSHSNAVAAVREAERAGASIYVESCPQYFTLLEHEAMTEGALRKFTPPARARSDRDLQAMWDALARGDIDFVSSDHAPSSLHQKRSGSIWDAPFGLPGVDTTLSVLLDGAYAGRVSYERVVEAYADTPARIYGLSKRKGALERGRDGDVVLVDPEHRWAVDDADIVSKAGWSPFSGRELRGRAVATFLRGKLVAREGTVVGEVGVGRFLPGPGVRGISEPADG